MPDGTDSGPGWGSGSGWRRVAGSMRLRITLAAAVVTAVAVALAGWMVIRSVEDTQLGDINAENNAKVDTVAERLAAGAQWQDAVIDILPVSITNENGDVIGSNPAVTELPDGTRVQTELLSDPAQRAGQTAGGADLPAIPGEEGLGVGVPGVALPEGFSATEEAEAGGSSVNIVINGVRTNAEYVKREVDTELYGKVQVTALAFVDEVARSVDAVTKALWVLFPGLVGVVALVAWWLAGRTLRPVEAIRLEAESIGGDSMHRRLPEPASHDEIGRLARTMNAMLGRLEASAVRQRQFVSDASHELRSPVAAIRTDLEVALHEGDRADWPVVARAVLAEEGRLETLLADLLVLASDDESAAATRTSMVDVGRLAAEEASRGRRVPVSLDSPDDADPDAFVVEGVASRLDRALANLVDNAARHADSRVRVTVARQGDRVRAVVDDDGPGIPAIDRERIFERFTRLDGSRARDRGGAGLGLAVVRSIATRHGGYVWADTSPLGGARFTLELPAARP